MQGVGGCRGQVDVGRRGVVERDAEYLADLARLERIALRLVDPVLADGWLARRQDVDDAADGAFAIYDGR